MNARDRAILDVLALRGPEYSLQIEAEIIVRGLWRWWHAPISVRLRVLQMRGLVKPSVIDKSTPELVAMRGGHAPTYWALTTEGWRARMEAAASEASS